MQRQQAQECPQGPVIPGSAQSHLRNLGENSRLESWLHEQVALAYAAFVAFQDLQELDRHPAARQALLTAMIEASMNDPRPGISIEKFREQFLAQMREDANTEPPAP